jgi:hypothetical protein
MSISSATRKAIDEAELAGLEQIASYGRIVQGLQGVANLVRGSSDNSIITQAAAHCMSRVVDEILDLQEKREKHYYDAKIATAHRWIKAAREAFGDFVTPKCRVHKEESALQRHSFACAFDASDHLAWVVVECVEVGVRQSASYKEAWKQWEDLFGAIHEEHPDWTPEQLHSEFVQKHPNVTIMPHPLHRASIIDARDSVLANFRAYYETWPDANIIGDAIRQEAAWTAEFMANSNQAEKAPTPTIWFHGDCQYSINQSAPMKVSDEFDCILRSFLDSHTALKTTELIDRSGVTNVSRAMARLVQWNDGMFKTAMRVPNGKSKGGYFINVRTAVDIR